MQTVTEQLLVIIRNYERSTGSRPTRILIDGNTVCYLTAENYDNPEIFHTNSENSLMFDGIETWLDPSSDSSCKSEEEVVKVKLLGLEKEYEIQIPQGTWKINMEENENVENGKNGSSDND